MSDDRPSEVLGALPSTRPHRRSEKRTASAEKAGNGDRSASTSTGQSKRPAARASKPKPARARTAAKPKPKPLRQPAQPAGTPAGPANLDREPPQSGALDMFGTAVQAAAELAEIGLSVAARAVRGAVTRLPRP